jgi:tight adherence protein B
MDNIVVEPPLAPMFLASLLAGAAVGIGAYWIGPTWDTYTRRYIADLSPRLVALGMDTQSVNRWLRWWGLALFATIVLFGIVGEMPPVAFGMAYLVFVAPHFYLDHLINKRRILLRDQMVRASAGLANATRAGLSLPQGLETLSKETPAPLATELRRIVHDYHSGRPLTDSLREVARRIDVEAFTMFTAAILVCLERGGKVTYALDRISSGLQELQRLERKLEADSAAGRKLALVLGLFPLFFLFMFGALDPISTGMLFQTLIGQFVLLAVGVLIYVAMRWCMVILDLDF